MSDSDSEHLWKEEEMRLRKADDYAFLILSIGALAGAYFALDLSLTTSLVSLNALWTLKLLGQTRQLEESQRRTIDAIDGIRNQLRR